MRQLACAGEGGRQIVHPVTERVRSVLWVGRMTGNDIRLLAIAD
jgi:hypothetical protein